ncbi:MAG: ATP-binding protein [Cyanobacteriota bacterium]|nr:ATP-binding protein [Cyanobacteriota bacterium]
MLIQFTVSNYLSFKEPIAFSMMATDLTSKFNKLDENNVFKINDKLSLLKSAAVYGANGSGKSNLLGAMAFMRWFVLNSSKETKVTDLIDVEEFRLSSETEGKPSFFEIVFILDGRVYRYGFEVDKKRVVSEWLFHVTKINESNMLFDRDGQYIEMTNLFKEGNAIAKQTKDTALFLSVNAERNGTISTKILLWFENKFNLILLEKKLQINNSKKIQSKKDIVKLIKELDLSIDDIKVGDNYPNNVKIVRKSFDSQGKVASEKIFDLAKNESAGTKKLFALAVPIINALKKGGVLGIDEFDVRLHPLIARAIINLFDSKESNPQNAQLIIMTYNTNLLSNEMFRRDQIWFLEKNRQSASDLYSLVEFKIENDANLEKDYLKGRYGAIPFIKNLSKLFGDEHGGK